VNIDAAERPDVVADINALPLSSGGYHRVLVVDDCEYILRARFNPIAAKITSIIGACVTIRINGLPNAR
jgi:hypothetical protein